MSRRRILLTADAIGGVWTYALDLARGLAPLGIESVVATLGPRPTDAQLTGAKAAGVAQVMSLDHPLDWLAETEAEVVAASAAVAALAATLAVDLVQLNSPALGARAHFEAPVVAVSHGCLASWWAEVRGGELPLRYAWHPALVRDGLARADATVCPSAGYAATIARVYGLARQPVAVHNGRHPVAVGEQPRADHAFTAGRLWDDAKNTGVLDAAAARLAAPLRAAGSVRGPHGETAEARHLVLLGSLGDTAMAAELAGRPVFVSAARFEPFGLAVLEAAQAGCALVLADIATFRELWDGAATFVPVDDAAGYAEAISGLLADPARRDRAGVAARRRASCYTPARMAEGMAALYRDLLARAPRRTAQVAA